MGKIKLVPKGFLTATQAAKFLSISRNYVYKLINSKRLKLYSKKKPYFVNKADAVLLKGKSGR